MKPGEVVGLMLPNIPEYVVCIHGAMEAGMIVTFVNPLYTAGQFVLCTYIQIKMLHIYWWSQATTNLTDYFQYE